MAAELNIDALIEQEVKKDNYRRDYNQKPEVQARRKVYNVKKREMAKIARAVMKGEITKEVGQAMIAALEAEASPASE